VAGLVLFDLDGTLADTLADIASAMNRALSELGLPTHRLEDYAPWVGEGVARLAERALPPDRVELLEPAVSAFRADYAANLLVRTVPYPGIPELLDELRGRGIALAVLSNKPDPLTRRLVADLFSRWQFEAVVGQRPETPRKPDPGSALTIARAAGHAPAACALVGDTPVDVETALGAGMLAVGVQWGFCRRDDLERAGAHAIVDTPAELVPVLTES
jgi:phosphoglycolate phosphatase